MDHFEFFIETCLNINIIQLMPQINYGKNYFHILPSNQVGAKSYQK